MARASNSLVGRPTQERAAALNGVFRFPLRKCGWPFIQPGFGRLNGDPRYESRRVPAVGDCGAFAATPTPPATRDTPVPPRGRSPREAPWLRFAGWRDGTRKASVSTLGKLVLRIGSPGRLVTHTSLPLGYVAATRARFGRWLNRDPSRPGRLHSASLFRSAQPASYACVPRPRLPLRPAVSHRRSRAPRPGSPPPPVRVQ